MKNRQLQVYTRILRRVAAVVRSARISLYSAQAAFFVFFSAIPLCILLFTLFHAFMPQLNDYLTQAIAKYYGAAGLDVDIRAVQDYLDTGVTAASASMLAVFWSATRGVRAIGEGISGIYGSAFGQKNLFFRYLYSLAYTVILILSVMLALVVLAFGRYLLQFAGKTFPGAGWFWRWMLGWRFCIVAVLFTFFFTLFYKLLGVRGTPVKGHLPGAVFSALAWIVYSLLFSLYLRYFSAWQSIYGGLSFLLILMLWTYGCMYMMMLGALINVYFLKRTKILK